ncbi:MAG: hypothetical protein EOM40_02320 [Clostridia bacterium]|nr:hypothetical protein [Clostridia bacterium]NCC42321.1 hypothetical protein [Clostridia bacterium]
MRTKKKEIEHHTWCRECVNKNLHLDLRNEDCIYLRFPYVCESCKKTGNIVKDIRWWKKYKLIKAGKNGVGNNKTGKIIHSN